MKKPFRNQSTALLITLVSLIGFLLLVFLRSNLAPTDSAVNTWAASIHTSSLTIISEAIATLFDTIVLLPLSLLIAAILYLRHHRKYAVLLLAAMAGITLIVNATKTLIQSPRPNGIVLETGYSFPSGHVTSTMVFLGLITYFAWQHWRNPRTKPLTTLLYVAVESLVGFSRVYLNVHWFSDILGGYLLGLFWLTFTIFLYQYSENRWPNKTLS